jgi:hypothetical protein
MFKIRNKSSPVEFRRAFTINDNKKGVLAKCTSWLVADVSEDQDHTASTIRTDAPSQPKTRIHINKESPRTNKISKYEMCFLRI